MFSNFFAKIPEITVQELKEVLEKNPKSVQILDVREPYEHQIAKLPGSKLIPLGELMSRVKELDPNVDYVVHCRSGGRSSKAIEQLQKVGFKKLRNLKGGLNAWADLK